MRSYIREESCKLVSEYLNPCQQPHSSLCQAGCDKFAEASVQLQLFIQIISNGYLYSVQAGCVELTLFMLYRLSGSLKNSNLLFSCFDIIQDGLMYLVLPQMIHKFSHAHFDSVHDSLMYVSLTWHGHF